MARFGAFYLVSRRSPVSLPRTNFPQRSRAGIVFIVHDSHVSDPLHNLINNRHRYKKPLTRLHGISKSVGDLEVQSGCAEEPVKQCLELRPVDVAQLVSRNHLHFSEQERRVEFRAYKSVSSLPPVTPIL